MVYTLFCVVLFNDAVFAANFFSSALVVVAVDCIVQALMQNTVKSKRETLNLNLIMDDIYMYRLLGVQKSRHLISAIY